MLCLLACSLTLWRFSLKYTWLSKRVSVQLYERRCTFIKKAQVHLCQKKVQHLLLFHMKTYVIFLKEKQKQIQTDGAHQSKIWCYDWNNFCILNEKPCKMGQFMLQYQNNSKEYIDIWYLKIYHTNTHMCVNPETERFCDKTLITKHPLQK